MRVYVNQQPVEVAPRHDGAPRPDRGSASWSAWQDRCRKLMIEWGNEVGLDGALAPEMKIYVK